METIIEFKEKKDHIEIEFHVFFIGCDKLIVVEGGHVPHIGSMTIGNKEEELTHSLKGHMEHVITKNIFDNIRQNLRGNVIIVGGIHFDNISKDDIKTIQELCLKGAMKINEVWKEQ